MNAKSGLAGSLGIAPSSSSSPLCGIACRCWAAVANLAEGCHDCVVQPAPTTRTATTVLPEARWRGCRRSTAHPITGAPAPNPSPIHASSDSRGAATAPRNHRRCIGRPPIAHPLPPVARPTSTCCSFYPISDVIKSFKGLASIKWRPQRKTNALLPQPFGKWVWVWARGRVQN
ncbi:hypothetical protein Taro_041919 [Colocasia esculenta]|uniref:Uncharacterized protein n=1 Tax=Colocasia esculenta TaxID=4460 RepID=A0A843WMP4_COLES|nr:hypothetical protein [Colocasia esculenta]